MEVLVKQYVDNKIRALEEAGIEEASIDAWILVEHITGLKKQDIIINPNITFSESELGDLNYAFKMRAKRIPVQHITGVQEFMGHTFEVNNDVLVPRFDTETVVEHALGFINDGDSVLDMCTGSGCIAISIALARDVMVTGVDLSKAAIAIARKNAKNNNADVKFVESDLFEHVNGKYDVIISNPPYIRSEEIEKLMEEVRLHDPLMALDGGKDGLVFYKRIAIDAKKHLKDGGRLIFEIGYDQGEEIKDIMTKQGYKDVTVQKDLAGLNRIITAHL